MISLSRALEVPGPLGFLLPLCNGQHFLHMGEARGAEAPGRLGL